MNVFDLFDSIGNADDELIVNAAKQKKSHKRLFSYAASIAACVVIACVGLFVLNANQGDSVPSKAPEITSSNSSENEDAAESVTIGNAAEVTAKSAETTAEPETTAQPTTAAPTQAETQAQNSQPSSENEASQAETVDVSGKTAFVFKDEDGNPLEGVNVYLQQNGDYAESYEKVGTTDSSGMVYWKPTDGSYRVTAVIGDEEKVYYVDVSQGDIGREFNLTW